MDGWSPSLLVPLPLPRAGVAQLAERQPSKLHVAGSIPVSRSTPLSCAQGDTITAPRATAATGQRRQMAFCNARSGGRHPIGGRPPAVPSAPHVARERRVICANCGTENEVGRKFCKECAARLALACPSCGAANSADAKFCGECAAPARRRSLTVTPPATAPRQRLRRPTSAPVAERRLVSVLFADLVGFTPFAEERDAEDVPRAPDPLLRPRAGTSSAATAGRSRSSSATRSWRSGARPRAHEDDAERAVRAGLELVDAVQALGPGIQARAGVLTGEAAVTLGADDQGMVAGDLVNTASRLQSAAPPGHGPRRRGDPASGVDGRSRSRQPASRRSRARRRRSRPGARCASSPNAAAATGPTRSRPRSSAATTSCACSRTSSTRRGGSGGLGSCRSSARPASARPGWPGSS